MLPLVLAGCFADETISGFADRDTIWQLESIGDTAFAETATIRFPARGMVSGQGPCNSYTARQTVPYPWIEITELTATRAACPALDAEAAFFAALQSATLAEVSPRILLLTHENGAEMVFRAR